MAEVIELWRYAGQREGTKGPALHAWERPGSEDLVAFDKLKGSAVGAVYEVTITKDEGDALTVLPPAVFKDSDSQDDKKARDWRIQDRMTRDRAALVKAENAAKRRGEELGDFTLRELHDAYWNTTAGVRNLMVARIISYLRSERRT